MIDALKPGVVSLIRDLNGNHVVQRCLQARRGPARGPAAAGAAAAAAGRRWLERLPAPLRPPGTAPPRADPLARASPPINPLQRLGPEDSQFIYDAAAAHCLDIATHRHGCCVLQARCGCLRLAGGAGGPSPALRGSRGRCVMQARAALLAGASAPRRGDRQPHPARPPSLPSSRPPRRRAASAAPPTRRSPLTLPLVLPFLPPRSAASTTPPTRRSAR